jgi:hypothetical protein
LKITYNVYFHHRGIPSEFRLSATDWTFWWLNQRGNSYELITELHRQHGIFLHDPLLIVCAGDIIRFQPNHISFRNLKALEDIYGQNTRSDKGEFYSGVITEKPYPPSVGSETHVLSRIYTDSSNRVRHSFLRRVINPSFSTASLKSMEPTMNLFYDQFIDGINQDASANNGIVEMNKWFHNLSFDVLPLERF